MTLADFEPLTAAEEAVIAGLGTGHVTVLGDGGLPGPEAGDDRRVSARLIRWLALGAPGDRGVRLHERGLRIKGALVVSNGQADPVLGGWAKQVLDLEGCRLDRSLVFANCRFEDTPVLRGAKLDTLSLQGSFLPGLQAGGLVSHSNVVLERVWVEGEVRLIGAQVGGDLDCDGGRFENPYNEQKEKNARGSTGKSLNADRLEARGDVFLRDVQAMGEVRLLRVRIDGNLSCVGGRFENKNGAALSADGARVTGGLFWRPDENGQSTYVEGALDLTAAKIGVIADNPACWPAKGNLMLDHCRYGSFTGTGTPVSAKERIEWLDLQYPARVGKDFWPQPWEHCAHVLREMGHAEDARAVLIAKEERQRRVRREIESARLTGARLRKRFNAASDEETRQACFEKVEAHLSSLTHTADPRGQAFLVQVRKAGRFQDFRWRNQVADYDALMARVAAKADRIGTRGADAALAAQSAVTEAWCKLAVLRLWDWLFGALIAYGHRPLRALGWLAGMWLFGAVLFGVVHGNGGFKPNSAFILSKPEWAQCEAGGERRGDHPSTLACYRAQPAAAGYPAFNAALYSLDTLVPVVDLEVQDYWVPDERVSPAARYYLWVHIGMGWFLALLAVAGVSGLIDTRATKE